MLQPISPLFFFFLFLWGAGLVLFFPLLFLVVLPNNIQQVQCNIDQATVTTTYLSRKTICSCTNSYSRLKTCDIMLRYNETGKCVEGECCFQKKSKNSDQCITNGDIICDLNFCWKTLINVKISYNGYIYTQIHDCEGDPLYCDIGDIGCANRLAETYKTGARTCYYRRSDKRLDFYRFSDNGSFIAGIFFTIVGGSMVMIGVIGGVFTMYRFIKARLGGAVILPQ